MTIDPSQSSRVRFASRLASEPTRRVPTRGVLFTRRERSQYMCMLRLHMQTHTLSVPWIHSASSNNAPYRTCARRSHIHTWSKVTRETHTCEVQRTNTLALNKLIESTRHRRPAYAGSKKYINAISIPRRRRRGRSASRSHRLSPRRRRRSDELRQLHSASRHTGPSAPHRS